MLLEYVNPLNVAVVGVTILAIWRWLRATGDKDAIRMSRHTAKERLLEVLTTRVTVYDNVVPLNHHDNCSVNISIQCELKDNMGVATAANQSAILEKICKLVEESSPSDLPENEIAAILDTLPNELGRMFLLSVRLNLSTSTPDRATTKMLVGMKVARELSKLSTCARHSIGCLITNSEFHFLEEGWNGAKSGEPHCEELFSSEANAGPHAVFGPHHEWSKKNEVHAEINALNRLENNPLGKEASMLFTTMSPCRECADAIIKAKNTWAPGLDQLFYSEVYRHGGRTVLKLLGEAGIRTRYIES